MAKMQDLVKGSECWVPANPSDAFPQYLAGKVDETKGDKYVIQIDGKDPITCECSKVFMRAPSNGERVLKADMDELTPLNMAECVENISLIFCQETVHRPGVRAAKIFSAVGPVLIVMNPFERLPCYSPEWRDTYHNAGKQASQLKKLGPHSFRSAEQALQGLTIQVEGKAENQAIVICGESGAGKTVTARDMLKYMCEVAAGEGTTCSPEKITSASMVLESFGNSTTQRNDNSSRFGRFTELFMTPDLKVKGCGTTPYLLERSRITTPPVGGERNYHIFFQLIRGADAAKYNLEADPKKYRFTKDGADIKQPGVYEDSDAADYKSLREKMVAGNFGEEVIEESFKGIAAVLLLGNVEVKASGADASTIDPAEPNLVKACALLNLDAAALADAMCHVMVPVPKAEPIKKHVKLAVAESQRDTVAKMIYSRIFDAIASTIDTNLRGDCDGSEPTVGLLDIFGFEDMACNGFEQLFINFTNERIQHLFNTIMFDKEKLVYKEEGIDAEFLKGPNNLKCVDLFLGTKPAGIVSLIADQVSQNRDESTDGKEFVHMLNRSYAKNDFFKVSDFKDVNKVLKQKGLTGKGGMTMDWQTCFQIKHYAGDIMYTCENFMSKSRDSLAPALAVLLAQAKQGGNTTYVGKMFEQDVTADHKAAATVGQQFRVNIKELISKLDAGRTLFVRCIKTNMQKVPNLVDKPKVLEQLVLGGVVAALEVRAAGLPDRIPYKDFVEEFGFLQVGKLNADPLEATKQILRSFLGELEATNDFKFGTTMVFMRSKCLPFLRGCADFKKKVFAHRIQRKLWFHRVLKVKTAMKAIKEAEEYAEKRGLAGVKTITNAFEEAKKLGQPVQDILTEQECLAGNKRDEGSTDMTLVAKALEPHMATIKKLLTLSEGLTELVEKYCQRKSKVECALSERISQATQETLEMAKKVETIKEDAEDCADAADPAEMESCRSACTHAEEVIGKLQKDVFPQLLKEGRESAGSTTDLDKEPFVIADPAPQVTKLLADAAASVQKADEMVYVVLGVRRAFNAAMAELDQPVHDAQSELDGLDGVSKECIAEGMVDIINQTSAASRLSVRLEEIKSKAKEPELYRTTAASFIEAVKVAAEGVAKAQAELEVRRRERAEREALTEKLDAISVQISDARDKKMKEKDKLIQDHSEASDMPDFAKLFGEFGPKCAALRSESNSPLPAWKAKVDALCEESQEAIAKLEEYVAKQREKAKSAFKARMSVFGGTKKQGGYSVS